MLGRYTTGPLRRGRSIAGGRGVVRGARSSACRASLGAQDMVVDLRGGRMAQDARVAVIGLGYVGLPLAVALAQSGSQGRRHRRVRRPCGAADERPIDDRRRIGRAAEGGPRPYTDRSDRTRRPRRGRGRRLRVRPDADQFDQGPGPVGPSWRAAAHIRDRLRRGQLLVLQSTTFPGTTVGPFRAVLEQGGLRAGRGLRTRVRA